MAKVYVFIAQGFEEVEALTPIDILRRSGVEVVATSIMPTQTVVGAHGVPVVCDAMFSETDFSDAAALILPGGMPGAKYLAEFAPLSALLKDKANTSCLICAICAAPMILGINGLLENRRATCYPGFETYLHGAQTTAALVETDGNIITGKGPGAAASFGFAICERLCGKDVATEIKGAMFF